ncbi:MAG: hypothetical protein KatS3mg105_0440 [Gemmatales bacterium]|nr:MAG: hypothetical protein KatS3mg105_0440 [Gemmatales bacterium]
MRLQSLCQCLYGIFLVGMLPTLAGCGKEERKEQELIAKSTTPAKGDVGRTTPTRRPDSAAPPIEPGFTALLRTGELAGWYYEKGKELRGVSATPDQRFLINNDVLVIAPKDKNGKETDKELYSSFQLPRDFVLKFQFRAAQEAVSEIHVRNARILVSDFVRRNEQKFKKFRNDDWNDMEVRVNLVVRVGNRTLTKKDNLEAVFENGKPVTMLNGQKVDPTTVSVITRVHAECNGEPLDRRHYRGRVRSRGPLSIRAMSGRVEFRNLQIKEL